MALLLTRRHVLRALGLTAAARLTDVPGLAAADWPQFRGPDGQGHADDANAVLTWSEAEHIRWKRPVPGAGWSSPVVSGGTVWLTTAVGGATASLRLLGYDTADGRVTVDTEVFRQSPARLLNAKNSLASPTPIVDGDRVYVHFGAEGTAAVTTGGRVLWRRTLGYTSEHGNGGSPALYQDRLILNCDGFDEAFVVALDVATGKPRWKTSRRRPWSQAYSTPLVVRDGERDLVVSVGAFRTAAYDPMTGEEVWRVSYGDGFSNVPRPVVAHGMVYLTTGFQQPSLLAVRLGGTGDITRTHVAWTLKRGVPLTASPIVVDDLLYMVSDVGVLSAVDARSGRVRWQTRLDGSFSASPVAIGRRIYVQSEEGETTVFAAGGEFEPLATNVLDGATLASMAVAEGSVFIRTDGALYRIGR